jgi:hypothetical protein
MLTSTKLRTDRSQSIDPASITPPPGIPIYLYATVFSSLCVIVGLIWDICWHLSIGRDGLLSPPHLVVYLGSVVSGSFSGYEILRITFWGTLAEKARSVKIWNFFYTSLGALFCVWGALTMLISAPFDDWWHNAYGLDVTILSPPHTVLILGILAVQFGAMVSVISLSNQTNGAANQERRKKILYWLFLLSAGFLLTMWYTLLSEELTPRRSHRSFYYVTAATIFPIFLFAFSKAIKGKWTLTGVSAIYSSILLITLWIIPLFPAEPKLGPILNHIDHYQGFAFPLLLIVPCFVLDLLRQRTNNQSFWKQTLMGATVFFFVFLVVQWNMGAFLLESPLARNWFFGSHYWYFGNNPNWEFRYQFNPGNIESTSELILGLGKAWLCCVLSTGLGIKWGTWMHKIQR